jgi:hypothetical protein
MRRRTSLVIAGVMAAAMLAAPTMAAADRVMSLSASKFDFSAQPGQDGTGEVTVINEGSEALTVRVYAADQVISEDGTASYVVPALDSNPLSSPASWVTFELPEDAKSTGNIPYVEIEPGGRVPVKFDVVIPEAATPGDRQAVLFFEMFTPGAPEGGTARVNARLGARIQTRVKGELVEKLDVRPFVLPAFVVGSLPAYSFSVRNEGNTDQQVSVRMLVLDRSESEKSASEVLTNTPVYASSTVTREGVLQLPKSSIGPTRVRLVASYTGEAGIAKSIEKDRTLWVFPLWLIIAIGALLVLLLLSGVWMASRRAAQRGARRRAGVRGPRERYDVEVPDEPENG